MKGWIIAGCALLLGQGPALAQEEEPVEAAPVEEAPVEEVVAEEAPADEVSDEEVAGEDSGEDAGWPISGFVDLYYVPTADLGSAGAHAYADGAGGRVQVQFWKALAVSGEYTTRTFDDDSTLDEQRVGLGAVTRNGAGDTAGLFVEYQRLDFEAAGVVDGYAVHGRLSHPVYEWLRFQADLGYKRLEGDAEKASGFEFSAGVAGSYGPFGLFADWRRSQLEGKDTGARLSLEDVRVGARYTFGD
ncbi:MAG: hypothetical protein ACRES8_03070 [Nevskiaceae bacterium]